MVSILLAALLSALGVAGCEAAPSFGSPLEASWEDYRPFAAGLSDEQRRGGLSAELKQATVYHLELQAAGSPAELSGRLRALYTNRSREPIRSVSFFVFANLFPGAFRILAATAGGRPVEPAFPAGRHLAVLALPEPLRPGGRVELGLDYEISAPGGEGQGGLAAAEGVVSLAAVCPTIPARSAWAEAAPVAYGDFPAAEAAFFLARVSLPPGWELAAPGSVESRPAPEGRTETNVALGPARDLYLAAVRGYVHRERTAGAVRVVSLAPRGAEPSAELAAEAAAAALRSYRQRFGAYPYSRLTFVAAPFSSYGLEFPGIVLLASRILELSGSEGGLSNRVLLESTVAHETAHQWFYALVGSDPLEEPWLDEALAQYATWLYYRDRYGEGAAEDFFASFEQRWERVGRQPIPIGLPVRAYSARQYGAIVYGRAPLFLRALCERMGEAAFQRLLSEYVQRWQWRLATSGDFLALAEETCGCRLEDLAESWGALPARK